MTPRFSVTLPHLVRPSKLACVRGRAGGRRGFAIVDVIGSRFAEGHYIEARWTPSITRWIVKS
jgi:hypothetical protein